MNKVNFSTKEKGNTKSQHNLFQNISITYDYLKALFKAAIAKKFMKTFGEPLMNNIFCGI